MNIRETCVTGWREITAHKTRSILSFFAISIGVASVLYAFAKTHGMKESLEKSIELMGPGRLSISAKKDYLSRGLSPGLTLEDAREIRRLMPELYMVSPRIRMWGGRIHYGPAEVRDARIEGVTPEWRRRDWVYEMEGRFIDERDLKNAARVCVVIKPGGWIKKPYWAIFAAQWLTRPLDRFVDRHDLLGRQIRIGEHLFTVIGVLQPPPRDIDPRLDPPWGAPALVPLTAYHRFLRRDSERVKDPEAIDYIEIDTGSEKNLPEVKRRIESILNYRHRGEADFEIQDTREALQGSLNESGRFIMVGIILGCVALLSGGIGIMNVTLATIFLRVKEIGIRRALGATRNDILLQFVVEAMLLGAAGGVAGMAIGLGGISLLEKNSNQQVAHIAWYHVLASILIGIFICCAFSVYPAAQAAKLDPILALKEE